MEILLWQARTNKGWVLEQLEKKSGVSKATLNRIENGQTSPTNGCHGESGKGAEHKNLGFIRI